MLKDGQTQPENAPAVDFSVAFRPATIECRTAIWCCSNGWANLSEDWLWFNVASYKLRYSNLPYHSALFTFSSPRLNAVPQHRHVGKK